MEKAQINGVELEYEVTGSGEPILLISTGPIADSFRPFLSEQALVERFRLISYHQRGQVGSTRGTWPISFAEHAADAAALLAHLGIHHAHVAGHSTGATIALQLAGDQPGTVHSLALLEPPLTGAAGAGAFFEKAAPALTAYAAGDRGGAMAAFLSIVGGLRWETCRTVLEQHVPGGEVQAIADADTFFESYLPALAAWEFGPKQATSIAQPMLSVLGTESDQWFLDSHELLRSWFPQVEDCAIDGVGHLLHMQCPAPVAHGVAEFFARHPMASS